MELPTVVCVAAVLRLCCVPSVPLWHAAPVNKPHSALWAFNASSASESADHEQRLASATGRPATCCSREARAWSVPGAPGLADLSTRKRMACSLSFKTGGHFSFSSALLLCGIAVHTWHGLGFFRVGLSLVDRMCLIEQAPSRPNSAFRQRAFLLGTMVGRTLGGLSSHGYRQVFVPVLMEYQEMTAVHKVRNARSWSPQETTGD